MNELTAEAIQEPTTAEPTPEDMAELDAYLARLSEPLDECVCCRELILVGDDSERMGSRFLCRRCVNWLQDQEQEGATP